VTAYSARLNYIASMISFGVVGLSSITETEPFFQNIALATGLMTGLTAVIQILISIKEGDEY